MRTRLCNDRPPVRVKGCKLGLFLLLSNIRHAPLPTWPDSFELNIAPGACPRARSDVARADRSGRIQPALNELPHPWCVQMETLRCLFFSSWHSYSVIRPGYLERIPRRIKLSNCYKSSTKMVYRRKLFRNFEAFCEIGQICSPWFTKTWVFLFSSFRYWNESGKKF